jgi:hypothetical protein
MSDRYEVEMVMDEAFNTGKSLTMTGNLEVVCAALVKALSFPPYGLIALKVKRV